MNSKTSHQIAKEIDLKRVLSIIEDLPPIEKKEPYNFDLPIMEVESKIIKKLTLCETK
jgi:hypothetical protein